MTFIPYLITYVLKIQMLISSIGHVPRSIKVVIQTRLSLVLEKSEEYDRKKWFYINNDLAIYAWS